MTDDNRFYILVIMKRTQISLSEEEYELAKKEARRRGVSLAELFRQSLRSVLPVDQSKPWMNYSGFVNSGDPDSSASIDDIVYGSKE